MTIKQLFPYLSDDGRLSMGRRFSQSFRSLYKNSPSLIEEDGFQVCDYAYEFLERRKKKLVKRFSKKYPNENIESGKPKRNRIKATKVDKNG